MTRGLARLAELERARLLEESARSLTAHAGMYSTEYDWVLNAYGTAKKFREEAKRIREEGEERDTGY